MLKVAQVCMNTLLLEKVIELVIEAGCLSVEGGTSVYEYLTTGESN